MKEKTSHPILVTIIIILSVAFCTTLFTIISQNFRAPSIEVSEEDPTPVVPGDTKPYNFDYSWAEHLYIAHAFGGILGDSYTNSYEAFLLNYDLGHRVFEVDLDITDDGEIVLSHDASHWHSNATLPNNLQTTSTDNTAKTFTYDNFISSLWYGKYHSLDLADLLRLMQSHPDAYIVTDSKYTDKTTVQSEFDGLAKLAKSIDESILDRFIIQIYHPEMLDWIMEIYPWKSVIYTLYADPNWTPESVLEFASQSGVNFITIPASGVAQGKPEPWPSSDLKIAVHTINQLNTVEQLRSLGISVFYTDYLLPRP